MKVLDKGFVELIDSMGNDYSIVNAARVSFNRDQRNDNKRIFELGNPNPIDTIVLDDKDKKLIKYMLKNGHTSPFEHVVFTFRIKCPIFVRAQWHRHRTWSYNEISRRYTSEGIDFYIPTELRKQGDTNRQASKDDTIKYGIDVIENLSRKAWQWYETLISYGVSREQARMILPQNMYTTFYGTVNLHNLLKFLHFRNHPDAQYEMRLYAQVIDSLVQEIVPNTYNIWKDLNSE